MRVEGLNEAVLMLDGIGERFGDLEPSLAAEAERINALTEEAFRSERSPDGTSWPPRKATSTDRKGRAAYPRRTTPRRSGRLERETDARATGREIVIESRAPYAGYAHDRRPFLPFDPDTLEPMMVLDGIEERIADYVIEGDVQR